MGLLRLLYCDSAGVRRCRVLVCDAPPPAADSASTSSLAGATQPAACSTTAANLEVTPSIALAAAAGAIPAPAGARPPLQNNMSLSRVSEDRVLSPEATLQQQEVQQPQVQAPQQEPALDQGRDQPQSSPGATLPKLGSFTTPSGIKPSPSMILAAAAGAIAVPPGAEMPRPYSSSSLDELSRQPSGGLDEQGRSAWDTSLSRNSSASGLDSTPSMALAAAAGAIAYSGVGSAASSRHQSPSRLASSSTGQQLSPVPLSRLSPARPRPLVSAFLRAPPSITAGVMGSAAGGASAAAAGGVAAAAQYSLGLTKACMAMPAFADVVVESSGLAPVGEVLLLPDLSAAVPATWVSDTYMAPVDMMEKDLSKPWTCCPRSALKRALSLLESRHNLSLQAGFELEFVLLKPAPLEVFKVFPEAVQGAKVLLHGGQAWVPQDSSNYCQTAALTVISTDVLHDILTALQAAGIGVIQYHAEAAPGQFEVALQHYPALQAADKLLLAREVVSGVVNRHGLAVTWLPKPMAGQAGSGCHVHFSLVRGGCSVMVDAAGALGAGAVGLPPGCYAISTVASSFMSGILNHLPALLPFTAPSTQSYERLQPCCWSGAHVCWGYDNREAPLRVCCPRGGPEAVNVEFKAMDHCANPYLGLAALVAAGMTGLEEGGSLPAPVQVDPGANINARAAAQLQALPADLTKALQAWEHDKKLQAAVQDVLGKELTTAFMAVRQCEAEAKSSVQDLLLRY